MLVDQHHRPLWEVHFDEMDLLQAGSRQNSAVRRAKCRSLRPGLDTLLQAEQLAWDQGAKRLELKSVKASSNRERAWFRAPQARWEADRETFTTMGPVHFQHGEVHLRGQRLTVDTGLRRAQVDQLTAQAQVDSQQVWSAQAKSGEATPKAVCLTQTAGRLTEIVPAVTFKAARVTWQPTEQVLVLEGNLQAQRQGTVVTTAALTWDRRKAQWRGTHPLVVRQSGWRIQGTGLIAPTDLRAARITAPSATLTTERALLYIQGRTVELTPEGQGRLCQAEATLRQSGLTVRMAAPQAHWDPRSQTLSLTGGVRVVAGSRAAQLVQVTWSARAGQWVGTGPVLVWEEDGGRLTGDHCAGDTGWRTWSLTSVEWTFQDAVRKMDWVLRGRRASRQADGTLVLQQVTGTVRDATGPLNMAADRLRWRPLEPAVAAEGRVRLEAPLHGFRLRADRLEWQRDRQRIIAAGEVEGASGLQEATPLRWSGPVERWVYDLALQRVVEVRGRPAP